MATPATKGALNGASDGFFATVAQGLSNIASLASTASTKYLMDQWGLSTQGNGVDQQIFQNQQYVPAPDPTKTGLVDVKVSSNTVLILVIVGIGLLVAWKA
jgi:hypothetical protein